MTENEKLSAHLIKQIIGPLLQSFDKDELFELLALSSLVAETGAEPIKCAIEKRIGCEEASQSDITFLALYALTLADKEVER